MNPLERVRMNKFSSVLAGPFRFGYHCMVENILGYVIPGLLFTYGFVKIMELA